MSHHPRPGPDDPAAQHQAARLAARRALHTWQQVRQGHACPWALSHHLEPKVIDALGDAAEPDAAQPERVTSLRVQLASDRLAHGAAVLRRDDGHAQGVVLELRRDGQALPWTVTQLSLAAQRTLVEYTDEEVSDRRTASHRLPDDLTEALRQARQARDQAAAWVDHHAHERTASGAPRRRRWRQRLHDLEQEVTDLEAAQRAREVRQAALDADPTVASRIHQLESLLGDVPDDAARRDQWRAAARLLVGYRQRWDVTSLRSDLTRDHDNPLRASERDTAVAAVEAYTGHPLTQDARELAAERPLHRDVAADDEDLSLDL